MTNPVGPVRVSALRRVQLTLSLATFGAFAGAVAGGLSALVVGAVLDRSARALFDGSLLLFGATLGAPLGAVLLPLAAWTLLRHVPFGRAFVGTVAGTLIGGFAGWFIAHDAHVLLRAIGGGIVGFVVAATLLRLRTRTASHIPAGVV